MILVYLFFRYRIKGVRADPSAASTPERRIGGGRESPTPSTARSSRRDSLADKPTGIQQKIPEPTLPVCPAGLVGPAGEILEPSFNGDLFKEFQRQKQRLQETIQLKERERDELVRQLSTPMATQIADNRLQDDT